MFYRVSMRSYKIGDLVQEGIASPSGLGNIRLYAGLIAENDERAVKAKILMFQRNNLSEWKIQGTAYKEAHLEYIRQREFPGLPCRYSHLMVFSDLNSARTFNRKYRNNAARIFGVDTTSAYFSGDMNILDTVQTVSFIDVERMCRNYWSGVTTGSPMMECILNSSDNAKVVSIE